MSTNKLGPCPLCGGEAEYLGTCGVECSAEDCMMAVCSPVVWNRLSALADQNRRRGEALERCRDHFRECDRTTRGPSPMERMCEEALG